MLCNIFELPLSTFTGTRTYWANLNVHILNSIQSLLTANLEICTTGPVRKQLIMSNGQFDKTKSKEKLLVNYVNINFI